MKLSNRQFRRSNRKRGQALVMVAVLWTLILGLGGLAVDTILVYAIKVQLSTSVDAAALAATRALARGTTYDEQAAELTRVANLYFKANFPTGHLMTGTSGRISTAIRVAAKTVDSAANPMFESDESLPPGVREVRLVVTADAPTFFMKVFGIPSVSVSSKASAARRDTNIMLVLDRSASLKSVNAWDDVQNAAVNFLQNFDNNRDRLGVVTFGTGANVDVPLAKGFKTNNVAKNAILAQTVPSSAYTNSGEGMWLGYAELKRVNDPYALNVIVFFTDGQPSAMPGKFMVRKSNQRNYSSDPYCNTQYKTGVLGAGQDASSWNNPRFYDMRGLFDIEAGPAPVNNNSSSLDHELRSGCYNDNDYGGNVERMLYYGADLPYKYEAGHGGVSMDFCIDNNPSGSCNGNAGDYTYYVNDNANRFWSNSSNYSNQTFRGTNVHNGAKNLLLNIAQTARQDSGSSGLGDGVQIYTIGLGGWGYDADTELLKRVANDPTDSYGVSITASETEPQGSYIYSPTLADLKNAFNKVRSHVLRLTL